MPYDDDLSQKQLKNLKRRVVALIWETTPRQIIRLALICKIKVPKILLNKYTSEE